MIEPFNEIRNTIKHRKLNKIRITSSRKYRTYLKIIGIKMIVNIRIFLKNICYRNNINNEKYRENNRIVRNTI